MKISYADYIKKSDVSVLVAEAIFKDLSLDCQLLTIDDVADTTSGGTPNRSNSEYYGGEIPWLKSGELNDGFIESAEEFITEKGLSNSSAKLHPAGTLLIAMYGATAGKTGIINFEASTNQAVCAVFPNDLVSRDYLYWFFRSHRYKYIEMSKGGAQPNISQTVIKKTPIPVPEVSVQEQVVQLLNNINSDVQIELNDIPERFRKSVSQVLNYKNSVSELSSELTHQLDLVKQLRQAFLREAMQGKLVPQDPTDEPASVLLARIKAEKERLVKEKKIKKEKHLPPITEDEIPFEILENWMWCRLGDLALFSEAGKSFKCKEVPIQGNEWGVVKVSAVSWNRFLENENKLYSIVEPIDLTAKISVGDFIISRANTSDLVGKSVVVKDISKNLLLSDKTIRFSFSDYVSVDFINICNNSHYARKYYANCGTGSSPSMKNITRVHMNQLLIPLPSLTNQIRIVSKINELLQYCDRLEESIKNSQQQNEQLLQQVLREALEPKEEEVTLA